MSIRQTLEFLADLVGQAGDDTVILGVATVLTLAAPVADRFILRRKRVHFRVLYNSKIGLSPIDLEDERNRAAQADPRLLDVARLVNPMSIVVIRIRNSGSFDIGPDDFEIPVSFTFGRREVWDARVSEPTSEDLRQLVRENMVFFTDTSASGKNESGQRLTQVRASLGQRLSTKFGFSTPAQPAPPQWHGVRLSKLSLKRSENFKLVVVLREPDDSQPSKVTTELVPFGRLSGGVIKDEKKQRRFTWPVVVAACGVLLAGALIATLLASGTDPVGRQCAAGDLRVEGSTVFTPTVRAVAVEYTKDCDDATIAVRATGSKAGVRAVASADSSASLLAFSDGLATEAAPDLVATGVSVVVYGVVVNDSTGVDRLTTQQVVDIYQGKIKNWREVGGAPLPVRIVGRGAESGSRPLFEQRVLGGVSEGDFTSDDCETLRPGVPEQERIRCQRGETEEVVGEVSATPGAIGYVDVPSAAVARRAGRTISAVKLDGRTADIDGIHQGYPFWTVEYLYSKGVPEDGSVARKFVDYLRGDVARAILRDAGYTPCIGRDGTRHELCR